MELRARLMSLAALAIPTTAGIAWLLIAGAPQSWPLINAGALAIAAVWIMAGNGPRSSRNALILAGTMIALLFVPLFTGPQLNGIARWIPLGPVTLHSGALLVPALAVLAARAGDDGPLILLAALFAVLLQPDAASGFALTLAAVGLYQLQRDWKSAAVCTVGFFASIHMALHGQLPAHRFVERVLVDVARSDPASALLLFLALAAAFLLMVNAARLERKARYALAGSFFGFSILAWISNYPSVLIGYGASPILGYGLALGLGQKSTPAAQGE